jgi:large subunit ribosomal protein L10
MNRTEKHQTVESLGEQFRAVHSAFLINYSGLKVVDATALRKKIREIDGRYLVVKNTLAVRAAKDTSMAKLEPYFQGPTAIVYHPKDVVAVAKLLLEVAKGNPAIQFKAALVDGRVIPASQIQAIASLPSKEVLLGQLVAVLRAPMQRLASVLQAPLRDLALVLREIKK